MKKIAILLVLMNLGLSIYSLNIDYGQIEGALLSLILFFDFICLLFLVIRINISQNLKLKLNKYIYLYIPILSVIIFLLWGTFGTFADWGGLVFLLIVQFFYIFYGILALLWFIISHIKSDNIKSDNIKSESSISLYLIIVSYIVVNILTGVSIIDKLNTQLQLDNNATITESFFNTLYQRLEKEPEKLSATILCNENQAIKNQLQTNISFINIYRYSPGVNQEDSEKYGTYNISRNIIYPCKSADYMGTSTQFFFPTQIFNDLLKNEVSDSYYELKKINESHPILKEIKAMYGSGVYREFMENYLNDPKYSNKMLFNYYSILNEIQECGHTLDIAAITYENIYKARSVYKSPIVILFINDTIVYSHEYNTSIYHFYKNKYLSFEDNKLYVCGKLKKNEDFHGFIFPTSI